MWQNSLQRNVEWVPEAGRQLAKEIFPCGSKVLNLVYEALEAELHSLGEMLMLMVVSVPRHTDCKNSKFE